MPEAVYFDLDGTLFDDLQYVRAGLRKAGEELASRTGVDLTDDIVEAYFERGITGSTFDTVLAENDLPLDLVPALVDAYHANDAELDPFPDARPVLETLGTEYALGVITGGRNGREKLSRLGLAGLFDVVLVTDELGTSKRESAPFEMALEELDVPAEDAVYVGDRPWLDFPQPNRLGMTTIRVRRGRYAESEASGQEEPDATIGDLEELPDVLSSDPLSSGT